MTKRTSHYEAPEERIRQESEPAHTAFGYLIRCRDVHFADDILHVKEVYAVNRRSPTRTLNFARVYLPPNRLHPAVTLLKDRPDFARIVVAIVDTHLIRQQRTKSTATYAIGLASAVTRFLEYCWLNDIYHLQHATREFWNEFLQRFVAGGWHGTLALEQRSQSVDLRKLRFGRRRAAKNKVAYSCASLLESIGTNVTEQHVHFEYSPGASAGKLLNAREDKRPSSSVLQQLVTQLNGLVDLPKEFRAASLAHPQPYLFATTATASTSDRTENFHPQKLSLLICEAYRWVAIYALPISRLVHRVYSVDIGANDGEHLDEARLFSMMEAPETRELQALLGVQINTVRRAGDWERGLGLLGLMRTLLAACFVVLAIFNGRRKDELQSRAIGLYADGVTCLDEQLGLYEGHFYCEKTHLDYRPFYINEISFKAFTAAKLLSDVAWEVVGKCGGSVSEGKARKVFCMPPRGKSTTPVWFDYSADPGVELLTIRACGSADSIVPNAHMFRRGYAVVFFYRYENADLYALSQQLAHRDFSMTLHYVLEGPSRVLAHHAAALWGDGGTTRRARAEQAMELSQQVNEYAKVKLHDDVLALLQPENHSIGGGFRRLVNRFAVKMYGRVEYDIESLHRVARGVTDMLIGRGHAVQPFPHGNCNAGQPKPGAGCYREGRLARENASPSVCNSCPYHDRKEAHLRAIKDDFERQRLAIELRSGESLQLRRDRMALEATQALLAHYQTQRQRVPLHE